MVPRCQETGAWLTGKHPAPNSPTIDHIKRHGGDPQLFFDPKNVKTVSKDFHDSVKQKWERSGQGPIGLDGWPTT